MITHHPSDFTLARLAAGTLGAGPQLVVATHLSGCPQCRGRLRSFEAVGGAMLDGAPPTRLSPDAFARALKRLDEADPPRRACGRACFTRTCRLPSTLMKSVRGASSVRGSGGDD